MIIKRNDCKQIKNCVDFEKKITSEFQNIKINGLKLFNFQKQLFFYIGIYWLNLPHL